MIDAYVLFKVISGAEREVCQKGADFREVLVSGRAWAGSEGASFVLFLMSGFEVALFYRHGS